MGSLQDPAPKSVVNVASVTNSEDQDDQAVVLNSTNDPVVADPIAPKAAVAAVECVTKPSGIFFCGDALPEEAQNPLPDLPVQAAQLFPRVGC